MPNHDEPLLVGLMSGTSMDSVDGVLARFPAGGVEVLATHSRVIPGPLRAELLHLAQAPVVSPDQVADAEYALDTIAAETVGGLLGSAKVLASDVQAIGMHGQTTRHRPHRQPAYTWQLGNGARLASSTGIAVVCDFRRADMALGGQGAPLVPAFHAAIFARHAPCAIVNLGGIANVTLLPADNGPVIGFDTGPANILLDAISQRDLGLPFDQGGRAAATGKIDAELLDELLAAPFFARKPPKSTGREQFNLAWLESVLVKRAPLATADLLATLTELTARSVALATRHLPPIERVRVCGGGAANHYLLGRLAANLAPAEVATTADFGLAPKWVEAAAFAWLAGRRLKGLPGNLPSVTGASRPAVLGALYHP